MPHTSLGMGKSSIEQRLQMTNDRAQIKHGPTNAAQPTLIRQHESIVLQGTFQRIGTQQMGHKAFQVHQHRQSQIDPTPQPLPEANLQAFDEAQRRQAFSTTTHSIKYDALLPTYPEDG